MTHVNQALQQQTQAQQQTQQQVAPVNPQQANPTITQ